MNDGLEVQNELQLDEISSEDNEETSAEVSISQEDLIVLNNNVISGFLYVTGALGIIAGILVGMAFHGIFRSK